MLNIRIERGEMNEKGKKERKKENLLNDCYREVVCVVPFLFHRVGRGICWRKSEVSHTRLQAVEHEFPRVPSFCSSREGRALGRQSSQRSSYSCWLRSKARLAFRGRVSPSQAQSGVRGLQDYKRTLGGLWTNNFICRMSVQWKRSDRILMEHHFAHERRWWRYCGCEKITSAAYAIDYVNVKKAVAHRQKEKSIPFWEL